MHISLAKLYLEILKVKVKQKVAFLNLDNESHVHKRKEKISEKETHFQK